MSFNNAVNAKQQGTQYLSTAGAWAGVDGGSAGNVLTSNGTGVAPSFQAASAGTYYSLTPYIVGSDIHSQFSTIGAAITQAVTDGATAATPANIYVKPGTYVESPNIHDGIHLRGMISDSRIAGNTTFTVAPELTSSPNVLIQGTVTYVAAATNNDTTGSITDIFVQPTATNANAIVYNSTSNGVGQDYFTMTNCVAVGNGTGKGYIGLLPGAATNAQIYSYNCNFSSYTHGENGISALTGCWIGGAFTDTNSIFSTITYCTIGSVSTSSSNGPVLFNNCTLGATNVSAGTAAEFQSCTLLSAVTGGSNSLTFSDVQSFGTLGGAATINSINSVIGNTFVGTRGTGSVSLNVKSSYFGHTGTTAATITLPSTAITNQIFVVADEGGSASTGNVTINAAGGKTINGGASISIILNNGSARLIYDGTNYFTW